MTAKFREGDVRQLNLESMAGGGSASSVFVCSAPHEERKNQQPAVDEYSRVLSWIDMLSSCLPSGSDGFMPMIPHSATIDALGMIEEII